MKKSYKWPHDAWNEDEHPRDQQRQRSNTEESRKFSKRDSSRHRENYFEDENKSLGYQRNSYQMERKSKTTIQTVQVIPRFEAQKCNSKKVNCAMNSTEEQQCLNETIGCTNKSDPEENCKVRQGVHPLCPKKGNPYPDSKSQNFKDIFPKQVGMRMNFENKFPQIDDTKIECFSTERDSNKISINEENPSKNDMKHMHSSNANSLTVLQKYSESVYESNQSTQYYSQNYDDQSNANSHDLSKSNVCMYEERLDPQSDNMCNGSQRTTFLNFPAPHERSEFSMLKLIDLLYYNANLMQDQALFNFSAAVKCKILESIDIFPYPVREELEILCEITDGDQSEKNQQIITTRTCRIVRNIIEKFPHVLHTLNTPPPPPTQILVYQTMPNVYGTTNICYNDNKSPFLKIVQNSEVLLTSATDCNFMSDYKIVQNDKCVISKTIPDSFDNTNSNDYKDDCKMQNFNTNDIENNSTIDASFIAEENKNTVEESSKHHSSPPVNSGEYNPVNRFSSNKDNSYFDSFGLDKLINFNINAMHGDVVLEYAYSMKQRILKKINCFKDPYKNKLELLCELTDGTQRENNQKLINERMCDLIYDFKDEIGQKCWENFLEDEQSKDVYTKSHDENERLHGHRQNIDGQSRKTHPRGSHGEDEAVHEHRQNFTDEQSRNVHQGRSHKMDHEHQQNFSDVQSGNAHLGRSQEMNHEHQQHFSDVQSGNAHLRKSHKVVHEHNQNFSEEQSRHAYPSQSHEVLRVHRQNFTDEQSKKVQSRRLYSDDEIVPEHRQNFTDEQSKNVQPRRLRYSDEMVQHEHRQNFSDGQLGNVHLRRSYYKDETVQQHRENFLDRQPKKAHTKSSHYSDVKKR